MTGREKSGSGNTPLTAMTSCLGTEKRRSRTKTPAREVCAPETIDGRTAVHETEQALHDDTAENGIEEEKSPHHPPPNQFFSNLQRDEPDVVNDSFQLSAPSSKIKKKNRAKPKSKPKKDDERDLATRAKYPTLDTFLTASPVVNETSSKGVFGVGDSPLFRHNKATATEDEDFIDEASPSILSRNKTARNRVANKGDWFQCHEENAGVEDRKRKKTTPGTRKRNQTTKQGKNVSFKGKMPAPKRFSDQDDDLQRAIELSKEEAERHPMLEPVKTERMSRAVSPIDDAFDVLAAERPSSKPSK